MSGPTLSWSTKQTCIKVNMKRYWVEKDYYYKLFLIYFCYHFEQLHQFTSFDATRTEKLSLSRCLIIRTWLHIYNMETRREWTSSILKSWLLCQRIHSRKSSKHINRLKLIVNTWSWQKARENVCKPGAIGFQFTSCWKKKEVTQTHVLRQSLTVYLIQKRRN